MELPSHFSDFLRNIRPTEKQREDAIRAHRRLRELLIADSDLDRYVIATFLQGSYRRATDIKPAQEKKSDVDIIAVTNMDKTQFPDGARALDEFRVFLDKYYRGQYEPQAHSWGVIDGDVELDLVPTSAPSEAVIHEFSQIRESGAAVEPGLTMFGEIRKALSIKEAAAALGDRWKSEPLEIPDRARQSWERTHPLAQIEWTLEKNDRCNSHYVNVVRAVKWWWLHQAGKVQPKSYLLEAVVGETCPNGITSIAQGFAATAEQIREKYQPGVQAQRVPFVADHGLPGNNVLARLEFDDFYAFYSSIAEIAQAARAALASTDRTDSIRRWHEIFGDEFPMDDGGKGPGGYEPPTRPAEPRRERFAF
jgi:hypothetical protein